MIHKEACKYNCVAFADGMCVSISSKVLRDKTLTAASQFWRTCGVISAYFTEEFGFNLFSALKSWIVAVEYFMQSRVVLDAGGITSVTMLMLAFIKLRIEVLPQWSQQG